MDVYLMKPWKESWMMEADLRTAQRTSEEKGAEWCVREGEEDCSRCFDMRSLRRKLRAVQQVG